MTVNGLKLNRERINITYFICNYCKSKKFSEFQDWCSSNLHVKQTTLGHTA